MVARRSDRTPLPLGGSGRATNRRNAVDTAGVDRDADPWSTWPGPAALRALSGLFPGTGAGPSVPGLLGLGAAVEAVLRAAGRRLSGRRVTVPGTGGELSLCLESLHVHPEPVGLSLGQLGEVRVAATDVRHRDLEAHRAVLVGHNVHVRPLPAPTVVAAPVTLELRLRPAVLHDRLAALRPALRLEIGDGAARVHLARHLGRGSLTVTPEVTAEALLLRPRALQVGRLRTGLPAWLPELRIALPALPRRLRLRDVTTDGDEIVLHLHADEWSELVPPARLTALLHHFA
jgi:hypothetical protein